MGDLNTDPWTTFQAEPTEENFGPLYETTRARVYTICYRILGNREDAADAFQSAYGRLITMARDGGTAADTPSGEEAVTRTALREATNLRKRRHRRRLKEVVMAALPEQVDAGLGPDDAACRREVGQRVEALISVLPERYRIPLLLHYFVGLTHKEIAQALRRPEGTIAARISRGLKKLRPLLRRSGLHDYGPVIAAVATGAALLEAPASLGAGAVFAEAQALSSIGAATGGSVVLGKILLGGAVMKAKLAVAGGIVFLLGAIAISLCLSRFSGEDEEGRAETIAEVQPAAPPPSSVFPAMPTQPAPTRAPGPSPTGRERAPGARIVPPTSVPEAASDDEDPRWRLDVAEPKEGNYYYIFLVDDATVYDARNQRRSTSWDQKQCDMTYPLHSWVKSPAQLDNAQVRFVHEGPIARSLLFISPFRGGWWGIDEFQPANEAAMANLREIAADPSLSSVRGAVVDPYGNPVPHARVRIVKGEAGLHGMDSEIHLRTVECDGHGKFSITRLPCG